MLYMLWALSLACPSQPQSLIYLASGSDNDNNTNPLHDCVLSKDVLEDARMEHLEMISRPLLNSGSKQNAHTQNDSFETDNPTHAPDHTDPPTEGREPRKQFDVTTSLQALPGSWLLKRSRTISTATVDHVHHATELWKAGWTIETCSCIVAVISLLGMIATLWKHQNQPLPAWPQMMSINAIVSLFSLIMRAGIGVVVAEGCYLQVTI